MIVLKKVKGWSTQTFIKADDAKKFLAKEKGWEVFTDKQGLLSKVEKKVEKKVKEVKETKKK